MSESLKKNLPSSIALMVLGSEVGWGEISPEATFKRLTGFTGSCALLALEPSGMKTLFVDARYTLQALRECPDCAVMTCAKTSLKSAEVRAWLQKQAANVIYDPRNFSVSQAETLRTIPLAHRCAPLLDPFVEQSALNLKDYLHPGNSREAKLAALQRCLAADQALVLNSPESIAWLFNVRSNAPFTPLFPASALITQDKAWLCVSCNGSNASILAILRKANIHTLEVFPAQFANTLRENFPVGKRLLFDPDVTSVAFLDAFEGVPKDPIPDPTVEMRCIKTEAEIKTARAVHAREGAAIITLLARLKCSDKTRTEGAVVRELETLRKQIPGYHGPSFPSIVAFGSNAAVVHYAPSGEGATIGEGGLLIDVGGQYEGATTDLTRTLFLGEVPNPALINAYTRVLKGHIALAQVVFPKGTTGAQLDALARQFLWQDRKDYAHGTGHGVGNFLAVHEGPFGFSKCCLRELQPGLILSNEPGFYETGAYGVRLENLMSVRFEDSGFLSFDVLTKVPFDSALIDFTQLTKPERHWLAAYHKQVRDETEGFLEDCQTKAWLEKVCWVFERCVSDLFTYKEE